MIAAWCKPVPWSSPLLNAAVQFHTAEKSTAPVPAVLIDRWHRWGERGRWRWTLRTLPKPQLSRQLSLTHRCRMSWPVKVPQPSLASCSVCLFSSPLHHLLSASNHIWGEQNPPCVLHSVLSPEWVLMTRPDPPCSPAEGVKVYQYAYPTLWSSPPGCLNSISPLSTSSVYSMDLSRFP